MKEVWIYSLEITFSSNKMLGPASLSRVEESIVSKFKSGNSVSNSLSAILLFSRKQKGTGEGTREALNTAFLVVYRETAITNTYYYYLNRRWASCYAAKDFEALRWGTG